MQILLLLILSFAVSAAAVVFTQMLLPIPRNRSRSRGLIAGGIIVCILFSILAECVLLAGKPRFYYHTHRPGMATLKIFGGSCFFGACFYALGILIAERKIQHRGCTRHLVLAFLVGMCGAVILEIGYFNFRHFELIGSGARQRTYPSDKIWPQGFYFNRASWKFHPYSWNSERKFVIYTSNRKIRNITFTFDDGFPRRAFRLDYTDEAHQDYESIQGLEFIQGIDRSFSVPLHTVGGSYTIAMVLPKYDDINSPSYGISMPRIVINEQVPLSFQPIRFGLCFLAFFLITAFFPGSPLWNLPLNLRSFPQAAASVMLIAVIFAWFGWTVFSSYSNSGLSIREQKASLNENYQQYDALVDALLARRYALLETPHRYLEQVSDPYDMMQRERLDFDYPWDTAYYRGNYYVYFGAVPAILVLLPYRLLTGKYLDLDYPILGFCCLFVLGLSGIYVWAVRNCFPDISFGLFWIGLLLLLTPLNLTWCLRRTLVYELAITSGICFAVWGIFFMLISGGNGFRKWLAVFLSGSCTALAVGCRPTMIFVSPVVLCAAVCLLKKFGKVRYSGNLLKGLVFFLPYAAVGFALAKYNYERFDDPLEFGITWQLTTENRAAGYPLLGPYGRLLSIGASLFTFPKADLYFPFIHIQQPQLPYNGKILNSDTVLGLFAYPVMAFLPGLFLFRKRLKHHSPFLLPFCCTCLAGALGICVTASAVSVANRYLTDYLFLAAIPAVFAAFCFYEKCRSLKWAKAAQLVLWICGITGVCLFIVLSLSGEDAWFRKINPLYYDQLRYAYSPWL